MPQVLHSSVSRRKLMQLIGGAVTAFGLPVTFHHTPGAVVAKQALIAAGQVPTTPEADQWPALYRPLELPVTTSGASCPRTENYQLVSPSAGFAVGSGPVYATLPFIGAVNLNMQYPSTTGWYGIKTVWWVEPDKADRPILVRGRRVDGEGEMRFTGGTLGGTPDEPVAELRLAGPNAQLAGPDGWHDWASNLWVREPGCYAYQVDGANFSDVVVFEAVGKQPGALTPVPPFGRLPGNELRIDAGVPMGPDTVRLALVGPQLLAIQIDAGPSQAAPPELSGPDVQHIDYSGGVLVWTPFPEGSTPQFAGWDDGRHQYQLEVLDGAEPGAWSESVLLALAEAFIAAPEDAATPPPAG